MSMARRTQLYDWHVLYPRDFKCRHLISQVILGRGNYQQHCQRVLTISEVLSVEAEIDME